MSAYFNYLSSHYSHIINSSEIALHPQWLLIPLHKVSCCSLKQLTFSQYYLSKNNRFIVEFKPTIENTTIIYCIRCLLKRVRSKFKNWSGRHVYVNKQYDI